MLDSQTDYFVVGRGRWQGDFSFRIANGSLFRAAPLGLKNRLLVYGLDLVHRLFRQTRIDSTIWTDPDAGVAGIAGNTVRSSKLANTLYLLEETYTLAENGSDVAVDAHERFGPIPFLLRNHKEHGAVIHANGMSSTYYIPLLGADWTADYTVHPDRAHIDGLLRCPWAEAREIIHKLATG